tara:strand:+ start:402 stop:653 length:252 start_codon:yes stop_codon:yes gene_type:complete
MNYNVSQAREGKEGKTYWMKVGYAFEKDGVVSSIKLDALPLPNEKGEVWLNLFPDDRERSVGGGSSGSSWPSKVDKVDDEIPF